MNKTIIYEQPLNEVIRACLRLEQLFLQIDHLLKDASSWNTRSILALIVDVLNLLDRADLKAKLAKELGYHLSSLMRYKQLPEVDTQKVNLLTEELEKHARNLVDSSGKIGHQVRDVELLNSLRLHLLSPGGACSFDVPLYHYWLNQTPTARIATISEWLSNFTQIKTIISLILDLARKNVRIESKVAVSGFHQELLDPQWNLRMIRIEVETGISAYPEVSIGRHFLSIQFFTPDLQKRSVQYVEDLPFTLTYCNT